MLFIFCGRDNIGKSFVRDTIANEYGLSIIGKVTDNDRGNLDENFRKDNSGPYPKYIDKEDKYLEYVPSEELERYKEEAFIFDREIIFDGEIKRGKVTPVTKKYAIRKEDIDEISRASKNKHFLLVCTAPKTIGEIKSYITTKGYGIETRTFFIVGDPKISTKKKWTDNAIGLAKDYLWNEAHNMQGIIFNKKDDQSRSVEALCTQWDFYNNMSRKKFAKKVFIVRPFGSIIDKDMLSKNNLLHETLKEKLELFGLEPEITTEEKITEDILDKITNYGLTIVDLRSHNKNCYFEYGFAKGVDETKKHRTKIVSERGSRRTIAIMGEVIICSHGEDANKLYEEAKKNIDEEIKKLPFDVAPYEIHKYVVKSINILNKQKKEIEFLKDVTGKVSFEDIIKNYCEQNNI